MLPPVPGEMFMATTPRSVTLSEKPTSDVGAYGVKYVRVFITIATVKEGNHWI